MADSARHYQFVPPPQIASPGTTPRGSNEARKPVLEGNKALRTRGDVELVISPPPTVPANDVHERTATEPSPHSECSDEGIGFLSGLSDFQGLSPEQIEAKVKEQTLQAAADNPTMALAHLDFELPYVDEVIKRALNSIVQGGGNLAADRMLARALTIPNTRAQILGIQVISRMRRIEPSEDVQPTDEQVTLVSEKLLASLLPIAMNDVMGDDGKPLYESDVSEAAIAAMATLMGRDSVTTEEVIEQIVVGAGPLVSIHSEDGVRANAMSALTVALPDPRVLAILAQVVSNPSKVIEVDAEDEDDGLGVLGLEELRAPSRKRGKKKITLNYSKSGRKEALKLLLAAEGGFEFLVEFATEQGENEQLKILKALCTKRREAALELITGGYSLEFKVQLATAYYESFSQDSGENEMKQVKSVIKDLTSKDREIVLAMVESLKKVKGSIKIRTFLVPRLNGWLKENREQNETTKGLELGITIADEAQDKNTQLTTITKGDDGGTSLEVDPGAREEMTPGTDTSDRSLRIIEAIEACRNPPIAILDLYERYQSDTDATKVLLDSFVKILQEGEDQIATLLGLLRKLHQNHTVSQFLFLVFSSLVEQSDSIQTTLGRLHASYPNDPGISWFIFRFLEYQTDVSKVRFILNLLSNRQSTLSSAQLAWIAEVRSSWERQR